MKKSISHFNSKPLYLLGLMFCITLFMCNFASALEFDNVKQIKEINKDGLYSVGDRAIPYKQIWEKYKPIEIKNAFGLGTTLFKGAITEHTETCSDNCNSQFVIQTANKGKLIDKVEFIGKVNSYEFYLNTGTKNKVVDKIEPVCKEELLKNGSIIKNCINEKVGEEIVSELTWEVLDITKEYDAGTYMIELRGSKDAKEEADWIITSNGVRLTNWAYWLGVTPTHYWKFNQTSGNAIDEIGTLNLTNTNFDYITDGKLGQASNSSSNDDNFIGSSTDGRFGNNNFTIGVWLNSKNGAEGGAFLSTKTGYTDATTFIFAIEGGTGNLWKRIGTTNQDFGTTDLRGGWHRVIIRRIDGNLTSFVDGVAEVSVTETTNFNAGDKIIVGQQDFNSGPTQMNYLGAIDDLFIYNGYAMTDVEIIVDYNNGLGRELDLSGSITLNSPTYNYLSSINEIKFNCSTIGTGELLNNMSLYLNGILNETQIKTGTANESIFTKTLSDGNYNWTCQTCNSAGDCEFASENRTLTVDTTYPAVSILYPINTINYGYIGQNISLNYSINDTNIGTCWYEYNGTNTTTSCVLNNTFILDSPKTLTLWTNDTSGNTNYSTATWGYRVFENTRTFNSSSYETAREGYSINLTSNSSLTAVNVVYNGTLYAMSQSGDTWSYSRDLNTTNLGNNTVSYRFTYAGSTINSDNSYQYVNPIYFSLCNATHTVPYLNITTQDEATLTNINFTIPLGTFDYYLGNGDTYKTLTYVNTTENPSYAFCFSVPNNTLNVDNYVQYASTGYPQRIWNPEVTSYTNTTTNQVLYLLGTASGIYVTFQVVNSADQTLSGVEITAVRQISGSDVTVASGTTGADGTVTFWLNPDFSHTFTFTKTGYTTYSTGYPPTQTSYTITLSGGGVAPTNDYNEGMYPEILPSISSNLYNDTTYNFRFNLTSNYWDLDSFGFRLRLSNGSIVGSASSTTEGTAASLNYNVNNQSIIYMDYYWVVAGNYTNSSNYWIILNSAYTGWSIKTFFTDLNSYMAVGIFGLDNFGRYLIVFIIIFLTVGIMSYKYGMTSPMAITTMIFGVIYFFDVVVGLIPEIRGIDHLLTYLAGLILAVVVIREVAQ